MRNAFLLFLLSAQVSFAQTNSVIIGKDVPMDQVSFRVTHPNSVQLEFNLGNGRTGYLKRDSSFLSYTVDEVSLKADALNRAVIRLAKSCDTINIILVNPADKIQFTDYRNLQILPSKCK